MLARRALILIAVLVTRVYDCQTRDNGLGLTPPMGWNSWNAFGCDISEELIKKTTDAFVALKLHTFGYEYVNLDDCWAGARDNQTKRITSDQNFPDGIEALATYVHNQKLKFGLYSDAGNLTCAGRPGSLGFEVLDAQTYASWGVDYLKYDNCRRDQSSLHQRYQAMGDALNKSIGQIFYSMCEWGVDNPAKWAEPIANSWRTTRDIQDTWFSITNIATQNAAWWQYAGPGGWNDPDILEIGNGKLSPSEEEAHFSLWAVMKAPLLISCDLRAISNDSLRVLTNSETIAVNQDALGKQARLLAKYSGFSSQVYAGDLSNKTKVLLFVNLKSPEVNVTVQLIDLDYVESVEVAVRDLWMHKHIGTVKSVLKATVQPHAVKMYKLSLA